VSTKRQQAVPTWVLWTLGVIGLGAFVATWAGWVGLGALTGFGKVRPLPGIWDALEINTAVTLPLGIEAYAFLALGAWLSGWAPTAKAATFAMVSGLGSIAIGMSAQVAYHLLVTARETMPGGHAPWPVVLAVACVPNTVLGLGSILAHLLRPGPLKSGLEAAEEALDGDRETSLYRLFDSSGVLLYVGVSYTVEKRLQAHRSTAAWYSDVVETKVESFPTRWLALEAELEAIRTESPLYNVNGRWTTSSPSRPLEGPAELEVGNTGRPVNWEDWSPVVQARWLIERAEQEGRRLGRGQLMEELNLTEHRAKQVISEVRKQLAERVQ